MITISTINDLLFDEEKRKSLVKKQDSYIRQIGYLPEPESIMNILMERS